jgi:sugar/nucleoside kinase (ribokinase family)
LLSIVYNSLVQTPDYLAIGHVSRDLTPEGQRLGGSVAYAALTSRALGLRAAVVTACSRDLSLAPLEGEGIALHCIPSEATTTFVLESTPAGRRLHLQGRAAPLKWEDIPKGWQRASIVHLAPIAGELPADLAARFPGRFVGVTPQGWLRAWEADGLVRPATAWPEAETALSHAAAAVLSLEDLGGDESRIPALAARVPVLVVTRGAAGATVYWQGEAHAVPAPPAEPLDATGAGDIFAAAFFIRLYHTHDPLEAARVATALASASVQRVGLESVPTADEIRHALRLT